MTVAELMEELEDVDPDAEVRLAMQPSWPFEYAIGRIAQVSAPEDESARKDEEPQVVYLSEGNQLGYLPGYVSEDLGWK